MVNHLLRSLEHAIREAHEPSDMTDPYSTEREVKLSILGIVFEYIHVFNGLSNSISWITYMNFFFLQKTPDVNKVKDLFSPLLFVQGLQLAARFKSGESISQDL